MTICELRDQLRERNLKVCGNKSELIKRFSQEAQVIDKIQAKLDSHTLQEMTVSQLRDCLRKRKLKVGGNKNELIRRLITSPSTRQESEITDERQVLCVKSPPSSHSFSSFPPCSKCDGGGSASRSPINVRDEKSELIVVIHRCKSTGRYIASEKM